MSTNHKPPKFLIIDPRGTARNADDANKAAEIAQDIAQKCPQEYIDIYEHRVAFRVRPPEEGEPT